MADKRRAPLPIQRPDCCVIVERGSFNVSKRVKITRPLIDPADGAPRIRDPIEGKRFAGSDPVPRIAKRLDRDAGEIAGVRGTKHRNNEIWPFRDTPDPEGNPQIVLVVRDAPAAGDIDKAGHADRGVQNKANNGVLGAAEIALQGVVGGNQRRLQVVQKIVHRITHRARQCGPIGFRGGHQNMPIDHLVEVENFAIHVF